MLGPLLTGYQTASAFLVNDWAPPAGQRHAHAVSNLHQVIRQKLDSCERTPRLRVCASTSSGERQMVEAPPRFTGA